MIVGSDLDGVVMQNPFQHGVFPCVRAHVRTAEQLRGLEPAAADELMNTTVNRIWMQRMKDGKLVAAYDWDDILNEASMHLGGPVVPDVSALVRQFFTPDIISLLPGAAEGLQLLADNGIVMKAVANDYHAYQLPVLEALGIAHFFSELLTPEQTGFAKPDAGMFQTAGCTVHIGDTLPQDIFGANQAGLTSLWLEPELPAELLALEPHELTLQPAFR